MNAVVTIKTPDFNPTRLSQMLDSQRAAFLKAGAPSLSQRKADLAKLKSSLLARRHEFTKAVSADFTHRSPYETSIMDIMPVILGINYLRQNLRRWMRPQSRHVAMHFKPASAKVIYQPLGVIGIMSPWNYPVALTLMPLATALAAGNRAMIKPSESTPATNAVLVAMLQEIFPEEQVCVATGAADVGAAFSALPFDHLIFTGSTAVGRQVMRAASENLVPVTLELGGKSPVIIDRGFPLAEAAASTAYGKLANAGQTCIAPDYVLVHKDEIESFVAAYTEAVRKYYPAGASDPAYAAIINAAHCARLRGMLDDAKRRGARVIEIGASTNPNSARQQTIAPTLILNATADMAVLQGEIFGPILPVVAYDDISSAIKYVNSRPRPLALYFFGRDRRRRDQIVAETTSGNVTINDTLLHYAVDDLPFGGVGESGIGAYHGHEGFKTLSHAKGVFYQSRFNTSGLLRSPFGRLADVVLMYLMR